MNILERVCHEDNRVQKFIQLVAHEVLAAVLH